MHTILFWLAQILVFMIPWEDSVTLGSIGTLTRLMGLVVACLWLLITLARGQVRKPHAFHAVFLLFSVWNILSVFWSHGFDDTIYRIKTYLQLLILTYIIWDLYDTRGSLGVGLQAYVLGAWVSVGSGIANYVRGIEAYIYSGGRYSATGFNPGDIVIVLALGIPLAWHLATHALPGFWGRILALANYAYIPAALFAIALTGSRMGQLAVVPALLYILAMMGRLRLGVRLLVVLGLMVAIWGLWQYIPSSVLGRLATMGSSIANRDLGGRVGLWRSAVGVMTAHPLLGVGSGAFRRVVEQRGVAHNTFLSVFAELGVIGFALFAVILIIVVYEALHQRKEFVMLWLAILLVWATGVFAQSWEHRKQTWLFLTFVVSSGALAAPVRAVVPRWYGRLSVFQLEGQPNREHRRYGDG